MQPNPFKFVTFLLLVLMALALASSRTVSAQDPTPTQPATTEPTMPAAPEPLSDLGSQLAGLGGISALITVALNALKKTGLIKDGETQNWSAGLNLLVLAALLLLRVYTPGADLQQIDQNAGAFAQVGLVILTYIGQIAISQATHEKLRGVPIAGTSFTQP